MKLLRRPAPKQSESGFVSIVVTIIIMLVLTLIVVGFARLSRREQEQSLDRQLNTQAYYAAESAVNDARQKFAQGAVSPNSNYVDDCDSFTTAYGLTQQVGSSPNVQYTCLLVDPSPTELIISPLSTASSQVFAVQSRADTAITEITFTWEPTDSTGHNQSSCPTPKSNLPTTWPANCKVGMIRAEVARYNSGAAQLRATLIANTFIGFFSPQTNVESPVPITDGSGVDNAGIITSGGCSAAGKCSVTLSGVNSAVNYVRLRSLYRSNSVTVTARDATGPVELKNAQAVVDATGKANDILRRIQVRLGIGNNNAAFPEFALQSGETICKRFRVSSPDTVIVDEYGGNAAACAIN